MKLLLALAHTAIGAFLLYWIGFAFLMNLATWDLPLSQKAAYITGCYLAVIVLSIIAAWIYAIKKNTSTLVKCAALIAVPIYLYFGYQMAYPYFTGLSYCNEVTTEQGARALCTGEDGHQFYRDLPKR